MSEVISFVGYDSNEYFYACHPSECEEQYLIVYDRFVSLKSFYKYGITTVH